MILLATVSQRYQPHTCDFQGVMRNTDKIKRYAKFSMGINGRLIMWVTAHIQLYYLWCRLQLIFILVKKKPPVGYGHMQCCQVTLRQTEDSHARGGAQTTVLPCNVFLTAGDWSILNTGILQTDESDPIIHCVCMFCLPDIITHDDTYMYEAFMLHTDTPKATAHKNGRL